MKNKQRKIFASLLLGGLVVLTVFPILFFPKPVHAQFLSVDLPHIAAQVAKFIKDFAFRAWDIMDKIGAATIYRNALNAFLSNVASESATWIATGGNEGEPLFFTRGDYWADMGDSIAADWLDKIAKDFTGFSVCEPIDPTIKLNILLSLPVPKPSPEPFNYEARCSLSDIKENLLNVKKSAILQFNFEMKKGGSYDKFFTYFGNLVDLGNFVSYFNILRNNAESIYQTAADYSDKANEIFDAYTQDSTTPPQKVYSMKTEKGMDELESQMDYLKTEFVRDADELEKLLNGCQKLSIDEFCSKDQCKNFCPLVNKVCTPDVNFQACLANLEKQNKIFKELHSNTDDIINNFEGIKSDLALFAESPTASPNQAMEDFEKSIADSGNPLGTITTLKDFIQSDVNQKTEQSKFFQLLRGEWKTPESLISKTPLLPAGMTEEQAKKAVETGTASAQVYTGVAVADAIGTFTQTLFSKLQQNILKGFSALTGGENKISFNSQTWEELFSKAGQTPPASQKVTTPGGGSITKGYSSESPIKGPTSEELKAIFADVLSTPLKKGEEIRLIDEFAKCPSDSRYALPNNCVVDTSFSRAVEQELTIKEAMEKNYLHGDWYVSAPGSHAGNIDSKKDFSKRYSLTNATILAQAGIMPLGFQIAADEISRKPELVAEKFTLKQIVDGFYVASSPFYKLVNPQWRLKDFPAQCDLIGYSSIPQPNSSERQETCLQWRTCTGEKDDGTCHTWNYCTAYKNSWRFNADACQSQFDTCQAYTKTIDNTKSNWLSSTLNSSCDASGVGCHWYCQSYNKNFGQTESWDCAAPNKKYQICNLTTSCTSETCRCPATGAFLCDVTMGAKSCLYQVNDIGNTIFLNRITETCSNTSQGCTEFIRTKENLGVNLLANSSFESYTGTVSPVAAMGWEFSVDDNMRPSGQFTLDETQAMNGKVFAQFNGAGDLHPSSQAPDIDLLVGNKYSLSFYVKNKSVQARTLTFNINTTGILESWNLAANSAWQLLVYEFILPLNSSVTVKNIRFNSNGSDVLIDYLKLENGKASNYQDYGATNLTYLKKAPDYLSCYNRDVQNNLISADDDPACLNFIQSCSKQEVGCEKYTPTNGDPYIPAVAKDIDACPAECAGFDSFRERATAFYPDQDVNFIPRTASVCSASEVGCESYTNLEEANRGGEGREFYSYLRACQKPDSSCGNFYTWVGSETNGFELKRYNLRKNIDGSPATILDQSKAEKIWGQCRAAEDARTNSNCKEFYSESGTTVYYQLYKNTIVCNDSCLQLRKNKPISASACWPSLFVNNDPTQNQPLIEGLSFSSAGGESCGVPLGQQTCLTPKGEVCDLGKTCSSTSPGYNQNNPNACTCQTGICTLTTLPQESIKCSSASENCREYKGNDANTIRVSFLDDFELGTYYPWQPLSSSTAIYSNDSVYFGGHSLKVKEKIPDQGQEEGAISDVPKFIKDILGNKEAQAQTSPLGIQRDIDGLIYSGKFYLLSFLAKGAVSDQILSAKFLPSNVSFANAVIQKDWQLVTLGPIYFDKIPDANEKIQITSSQSFWLDNIELKDTGSLYLIKNSWTTPSSCSLDMVGCTQYQNRANESKYFKSFSQICSDKVVGCEALINTQNLSSAFSQTFNSDQSPSTDDVKVLADRMEYLVYDKTFSCNSADKGCQKLGLPNLAVDGQPTTWGDVFLKNNPDDYLKKPILCREKDQGCEEFINSSGGVSYLKDPGAKECEWREKVTVGSEIKTGWFKKDTDQPCYENYAIYTSDNSKYSGYAGVCPSEAVGCSRFIDPLATSGYVNPQGETETSAIVEGNISIVEDGTLPATTGGSYFYLDNFKINKSACNGKISLEKGCVLLKDNKSGENLYNSIASYAKSKDLNGELISPVSCDKSAAPFKISASQKENSLNNFWQQVSSIFLNPVVAQTAPVGSNQSIISCADVNYKDTDYCKYCVANNQTTNDTNLIIKVNPTRVCAEWLHCKNKTKIWQKETNDYIEVCNEIVRCQAQKGEGDGSTCTKIISKANVPLEKDIYQSRDVSWGGIEPDGYSLYNWRPVDLLATKVGTFYPKEGGSIPNQLLLTSYDKNSEVGVSGPTCGDCPAGSTCQGNICVVDLSPQAFPEKDSPFNFELSKTFENINVCAKGLLKCDYFTTRETCGGVCIWDYPNNKCKDPVPPPYNNDETSVSYNYFACQGNYRKAEYGIGGSTKKYFNSQSAISWLSICIAGSKEKIGQSCLTDNDCTPGYPNTNGKCEPLTKETIYYGKNNFCLSQDFSMPDYSTLKSCLLWYPSAHLLMPSASTINIDKTSYVHSTYADLQGTLTKFGTALAANIWFEWRMVGAEEWNQVFPDPSSWNGILPHLFSKRIESLESLKLYEFRAVASNDNGTSYGIALPFTTTGAPSFDFTFSLNPASGSVAPGGTPFNFTITVTMTDPESIPQPVSFSAENLPQYVSFSAPNCTPSSTSPYQCTSTASIVAQPGANVGNYNLDIVATGNGQIHRNSFSLAIGGTCEGEPQRKCWDDLTCGTKQDERGNMVSFACRGQDFGVCQGSNNICTSSCPGVNDSCTWNGIKWSCSSDPRISCSVSGCIGYQGCIGTTWGKCGQLNVAGDPYLPNPCLEYRGYSNTCWSQRPDLCCPYEMQCSAFFE